MTISLLAQQLNQRFVVPACLVNAPKDAGETGRANERQTKQLRGAREHQDHEQAGQNEYNADNDENYVHGCASFGCTLSFNHIDRGAV